MKPKLLRFRPLFDRIVWTPPLSNEEKQPTLVESLLPVTPLCQLRRASSDSLHDRWPNIPVGQSVGAHTKGSGEWIKHHGFLSTAILHFSCGFQFGSLNVWVSRCFQVGLQLWLVVYDVFPAFCPVGAVSKCFPNGYLQKWWDSSDGHGKGNHHQYNNYSDGDLKEYEIHCTVGRVRLRQKTLWPRGILILGGTQFRKSLVVPSCTGLTKGKRCKTSRTLLVLVIFPISSIHFSRIHSAFKPSGCPRDILCRGPRGMVEAGALIIIGGLQVIEQLLKDTW